MDSCCAKAAEKLAVKQGKVLRVILLLSLGMFIVEASAGRGARASRAGAMTAAAATL